MSVSQGMVFLFGIACLLVIACVIAVTGSSDATIKNDPDEPKSAAGVNCAPDAKLSGFSKDDMNIAALHLIQPRVPHVYESYLGGTLSDCDHAQLILAGLREKYKDFCPLAMRREIFGWIAYYEARLAKTRTDIETQTSARRQAKHRREQDEKYNRANELLSRLKQTP